MEDTLRAMSLSVAQLDGMASIDALLNRRGPVAFADVIYGGLGDLYLSQERYGDAADAYRGFVSREPTHPRAPYLQAEVIHAYAAGKFPSKVLDAKAEYVELYGLHSAYWQNTDSGGAPGRGTEPEGKPGRSRQLRSPARAEDPRAGRLSEGGALVPPLPRVFPG